MTVCVPAELPPVVPVTGESFCQCPAQTELSSDEQISPYTLSCTCGEEEQGEIFYFNKKQVNDAVFFHTEDLKSWFFVFVIVLRV